MNDLTKKFNKVPETKTNSFLNLKLKKKNKIKPLKKK